MNNSGEGRSDNPDHDDPGTDKATGSEKEKNKAKKTSSRGDSMIRLLVARRVKKGRIETRTTEMIRLRKPHLAVTQAPIRLLVARRGKKVKLETRTTIMTPARRKIAERIRVRRVKSSDPIMIQNQTRNLIV